MKIKLHPIGTKGIIAGDELNEEVEVVGHHDGKMIVKTPRNGFFWAEGCTIENFAVTQKIPSTNGSHEIGSKWIECEDEDIVEVVAHHNDAIVCWSEDEGYRPYDVSELLPIDERRKAVMEMIGDINRCHPTIELAEHLYDAGYRKQ